MKKRVGSILFVLALCLSLLSTAALAETSEGGTPTHSHCICGESHTDVGDHKAESIQTWTAWNKTDSLPDEEGYYYLTKDVTIDAKWKVPTGETVLCLNGNSITCNDGGNTSNGKVDVISVGSNKTFALTDCKGTGKITHATNKFGSGVIVSRGTFNMYGGKITGNSSPISGGGVYMAYYKDSKFNMYGGEIAGNKSSANGGGVVIMAGTSSDDAGTFQMYGGKITGNNAAENGGGVYIAARSSSGTFHMYGGSITGNNCGSGSDYNGGGVYVNGSFTVSGAVQIKDNVQGGSKTGDATVYSDGTASNVYLPEGKQITIGGALTDGAKIGVTLASDYGSDDFTAGWQTNMQDTPPATYFTADDSSLVVTASRGGELQLTSHTHSWTYSLSRTNTDNDTITATCKNCEGNSGSDFDGGTVTITAPTELTYSGTEKKATLEQSGWNGTSVSETSITYTKTGDNSFSGKPTDVGSYTASITMGGATASVNYTITAKSLGESELTVGDISDVTYTGSQITPEPAVKYGDTTLEKDKDYTLSYGDNLNAGPGTVTVTAKVGGNYTFTEVQKNFTIEKATPTVTQPTLAGSLQYTGEAQQLVRVNGTTNSGTIEYRLDSHGQWSADLPTATDAGSYTVYWHVTATDNYKGQDEAQLGTVSIAKANAVESLAPAGKNGLIYTGETQELITAGATSQGTIHYKLSTDRDWSTGIPTGTNAGDYTVCWYIVGDSNHNNSSEYTINVSIAPAPPTVTEPTIKTDLTYDGTARELITAGNTDHGTMEYKLGTGGSWSTGIPTGTDAGEYVVYWHVKSTEGNYAGRMEERLGVTISRAEVTVSANTCKVSKTYDGTTDAGNASGELSLSGVLNNDAVTVTATPVNYTDANVGGQTTMDIGIALAGTKKDNYKIKDDAATLNVPCEITKANYAETVSKTVNIVKGRESAQTGTLIAADFFGTTAPAEAKIESVSGSGSMMSAVSVENGTLSYTSNTHVIADSDDSYTVTISSRNYNDITATLKFHPAEKQSQATLTIRADKTTVAYGDTVTLSYEGGSSTGKVNYRVDDGGASIDNNKYEMTATLVGKVKIIATKNGDDTYADVDSNTIEITVNKRVISVKADDKSMTVNGSLPSFTVTYGNFAAGDTKDTVIATEATAGVTTDGKTVGSFDITVTVDTTLKHGMDSKYELGTPTDGTLTVNAVSTGGGSSTPTVTVPVSSGAGSVKVRAEVSRGTATVSVSDRQLEQVVASGSGNVTVDVSGVKNVDSVKLPARVVEKTNAAEDTALTVALPDGSVALDETALGSVAAGKDVTISVKEVPATDLTEEQQKTVGDMANIGIVVDVDLFVGGEKQSTFNGGRLTISIPYTPKAGEDTSKLTVWFIKDDGTIENKGGWYDAENGCFVFVTDHLSRYVLMYDDQPVSFTDVPADAWYAPAVSWAVVKDITGGIGDNRFGPDLSCTRAQLVTFLYRAAVARGMDVSVGGDTNILSYTDALEIPEYAFEAFQWACGAGIVQGYDGALMPDGDCTRAQIVTMLYRFAVAAGKDVSVGADTNILSYTDALEVPEYAFEAFQWATGAGIIQGYDGALMPDGDCTRAQIVTMLYRLLAD